MYGAVIQVVKVFDFEYSTRLKGEDYRLRELAPRPEQGNILISEMESLPKRNLLPWDSRFLQDVRHGRKMSAVVGDRLQHRI